MAKESLFKGKNKQNPVFLSHQKYVESAQPTTSTGYKPTSQNKAKQSVVKWSNYGNKR